MKIPVAWLIFLTGGMCVLDLQLIDIVSVHFSMAFDIGLHCRKDLLQEFLISVQQIQLIGCPQSVVGIRGGMVIGQRAARDSILIGTVKECPQELMRGFMIMMPAVIRHMQGRRKRDQLGELPPFADKRSFIHSV